MGRGRGGGHGCWSCRGAIHSRLRPPLCHPPPKVGDNIGFRRPYGITGLPVPGNQPGRYVHCRGTGTWYRHKCKHPKYTSTSEGRRQRSSLCKRARRGGGTLYLSPNEDRGWGGIRQFFLQKFSVFRSLTPFPCMVIGKINRGIFCLNPAPSKQ